MSLRRVLLCACALACLVASATATVTLPAAVGSHMVLQRDTGAMIWGWSSHPGTQVKLSWNGKQVSTTSSDPSTGEFGFELISGVSTDNVLTVSDADSSVTLEDVSFGDVLLCSGQSNMQFSVAVANNAAEEIADSIHYPQLRLFALALNASWDPINTMESLNPAFNWTVSKPSAFELNNAWGTFSATCYFTGRSLYVALGGKVPIGLVDSDWGGTRVEAWSSPDALKKCPGDFNEFEQPENPADPPRPMLDAGDRPGQNNASVLWNAMIYPLLPMRFKMALWYQGEANAGNPTNYACRFPAMIEDWREKFKLPLPFFFVQVAAYLPGGANWPELQVAQTAALTLSDVGMATAMDLGDPMSPEGAIHPRFKQEVGARLERNIASIVYKQDVVYSGPVPQAMAVPPTAPNSVVIQLVNGPTSDSLYFQGTTNCGGNSTVGGKGPSCCHEVPFVLGTKSGQQIRATSVEVGTQQLTVSASSLSSSDEITSIAYAFQPYAQCALYNSEGLPMTPFNFALTKHEKLVLTDYTIAEQARKE